MHAPCELQGGASCRSELGDVGRSVGKAQRTRGERHGDTASKVEAAAKAKIPGARIERVETDADTGSLYEAHVKKTDGSEVIVYVDAGFNVTGTGTMGPAIAGH